MPLLFHQNMWRYTGGAAAPRHNDFHARFAAFDAAHGGGQVMVCGFTEVMNNNANTRNQMSGAGGGVNLCGALGCNFLTNIGVGQTAFTPMEYITIGVNPAANPVLVGRLTFQPTSGGGLRLRQETVAPGAVTQAWENNFPELADYRGIAFVILDLPTHPVRRIAVGYLHNMYSQRDNRAATMNMLPYAAQLMLSQFGSTGPAPATEVYIGGDFNCPAYDPRGTRRIGYIYTSSIGMTAAQQPAPYALAANTPAFQAGGTLWSGNLYDYWYSNRNAGLTPHLDNTTINHAANASASMSDHCGVAVGI
ncbi:hypothetical protein [Maricaulis sp.]|uniref:hypothetical protein n=1 Tax=Maricaulis sp. TaxID=1486257 RepID=UPI0026042DDC|nr:hypothetical protein [Maricaulis sp.]